MNQKGALSDTAYQTILGLAIGWGGFSKVIPNILESLGEIVDLGNFIALRVFSIVFFLVPIYVFLVYWWVRGNSLYLKYLTGKRSEEKPYYTIIVLLFIVLNFFPIALFVSDQFFIYTKIHLDVAVLLFYYCFLAVTQFLYFSYSWVKGQRGLWKVDPRLVQANFLVFSLQFVMGIVMACFVEPWMIYKPYIGLIIKIAFLLYVAVGLLGYFTQKSNEQKMRTYKHFSVSVLIIFFFLINFPLLSIKTIFGEGNMSTGSLAILILTVILIAIPMYWRKHFKGVISMVVVILCLSFGLIGFQIWVMDNILFETNSSYIKSRFEAQDLITSKKIVPFIFITDKVKMANLKKSNAEFFRGNKQIDALKIARFVKEKNHYVAAFINYRTRDTSLVEYPVSGNNPTINLTEVLKDDSTLSIRYFFFKDYIEFIKKHNIKSPETLNLVIGNLNLDDISKFYSKVYRNIEDIIIGKHLKEISKVSNPDFSDYFHPINYYTETLAHYRMEYNEAKEILKLSEEYLLLDKFEMTDSIKGYLIKQEINTKLKTLCEFSSHVTEDGYNPYLKNSTHAYKIINTEFENKLYGRTENGYEKKTLFGNIISLKSKQYLQRYKRAQKIFKAYLLDTQRPGLFLFVFSLTVFVLLYWIHKGSGIDKENPKKDAPDELPGGFLNISIVVLLVLTVHIARPIRAESINPEKPYWMLDLNNWYDVSTFSRLMGDEDAVMAVQNSYSGPSSEDDMTQLLQDLKSSNSKVIDSNEAINESNNNILLELKLQHATYEEIKNHLDTLKRRQ